MGLTHMTERLVRVGVAASLLLVAAGCVYVAVTPEGEKVNLILDPNAPPLPPSCQLLKETTQVPMGGMRTHPTDPRSQAVLRNDAAKMGADTVTVRALGSSNDWYIKFFRCNPAAGSR